VHRRYVNFIGESYALTTGSFSRCAGR
jgi:hypothetical protein